MNASAFRVSVLLMIVRYSRNGSSGLRMLDVRSKFWPTPAGAHRFFLIPIAEQPAEPCTISRHASRVLEPVVLAHAVRAGIMASKSGSAIVTPTPFKTARRDMCLCVMTIPVLPPSALA